MSDLGKNSSGANFVTSTAAAEAFGVTNDYIARLCRGGKLRGVLEGRSWYVEVASLTDFFGREMTVRAERPIAIYYKETQNVAAVIPEPPVAIPDPMPKGVEHVVPTSRVPAINPGQISSNAAVITVCPPEAQGHLGVFFIPQRKMKHVVRSVVLGLLLLSVGTIGFGSFSNNAPMYAVQPAQVAAIGGSGFLGGFSGAARAVARTFDSIVYNIMYPRSDSMSQIVVIHSDRKVAAAAPVAVKEVAQKPVTQNVFTNPVVERVVEHRTVVQGDGISAAFLNANLSALENKLRALILASAGSGSVSSGNSAFYNVIAQTNRIDTLNDVDISGSRITHSTITDSVFENISLSGTTTLGTLILQNATTTAGNGFDISNGCFSINGVCLTGSGGGTPGGTNGQVQFNDGGSFSGVSTFTYATTSDLLHITNASTTNISISGGIAGAGLSSCTGSLDSLSAVTVSAWIKPNGNDGEIFSKATDGSTSLTGPDLWISGGTDLYYSRTFNTNFAGGHAVNAISLNKWQHVVVTHDGDGSHNPIFYVDGVLQATASDGTGSGGIYDDSAVSAVIGNYGSDVNQGAFFPGQIDDVRVYNRPLSANEVKQLYNLGSQKINSSSAVTAGVSSLTNGLVGHWTFDGADVTDKVYDKSGNGRHGYMVGKATTSAKVLGKLGQAFSFDGQNGASPNFVDVGVVDIPGAITLSAWIKPNAATFSDCSSGCELIANYNSGADHAQYDFYILGNNLGYGSATVPVVGDSNDTTGSPITEVNKWYHVVVTRNDTGGTRVGDTVEFYVDGVVQPKTSSPGKPPTSGFGRAAIGRDGDISSALYYFPGAIDDVRMYNRQLTAAEVKQLYNLGK